MNGKALWGISKERMYFTEPVKRLQELPFLDLNKFNKIPYCPSNLFISYYWTFGLCMNMAHLVKAYYLLQVHDKNLPSQH